MKFNAVVGESSFEIEKIKDDVFRINGKEVAIDLLLISPGLYSLIVDGQSHEVFVRDEKKGFTVEVGGHLIPVRLQDPFAGKGGKGDAIEGEAVIQSPMPGRVVNLKVAEGDPVAEGQGIVVVEAMKMENELQSPKTGKVKKLLVQVGQAVEAGQDLVVVE